MSRGTHFSSRPDPDETAKSTDFLREAGLSHKDQLTPAQKRAAEESKANHSKRTADRRKREMDDMFKDRRFEIVEEFEFVDQDEYARSPWGHKVRRGVALRQVSGPAAKKVDWSTKNPVGGVFVLGYRAAEKAIADYQAFDRPPKWKYATKSSARNARQTAAVEDEPLKLSDLL